MDWHKLQHTLFALDPTDPREDLAKLKAQAQSGSADVAPTKDYIVESVQIQEGTMPVEGDYSLSDFAALAGVTLTEAQKTGSAGQLKGKDAIKKQPAGTTKNPTRDKLVGEDWKDAWQAGRDNFNKPGLFKAGIDAMNDQPKKSSSSKDSSNAQKFNKKERPSIGPTDPGAWRSFLKKHTVALQQIASDPQKLKRFETWLSKWNEDMEEASKPKPIKARDPSAQYMNDLRKSGAMGAHKDKKKDSKDGKVKHKSQQYESIKEMLYAKLAEKK